MSQQPYPSYPQGADPYGSAGPLAPVAPPPAVRRLATLMLVRAALGVLGLIVSVATIGSLRRRIEDRQTTLSASGVDRLVNGTIAASVVFGLAFAVLYVIMSRKILARRNWARIVTLILSILGVIGLLGAFVQNETALTRVLSILTGLCDLVILLLLLARPTRDFFRGTPTA